MDRSKTQARLKALAAAVLLSGIDRFAVAVRFELSLPFYSRAPSLTCRTELAFVHGRPPSGKIRTPHRFLNRQTTT
jgi:hypothetical protein